MSVVDENAEWKTKRVSFFGAAKSFVSQLSIGQDLTKVSLPSVFLYPYSALELGASRSLQYFHILQNANEEKDPIKRMLGVVCFYISQTKKEQFEKKPSNSILAENHYCWINTEKGKVDYFSEQVSHHPPISAYVAISKNEGIRALCTLESQGVKFHGNSLGITLRGDFRINLSNEEYICSKSFPNIWIKNVILGTKRESWDGEISIICQQTKLKATFYYKEEGWSCTNVINGVISIDENGVSTDLWTFTGAVSQSIFVSKFGTTSTTSNSSSNSNHAETNKELFIDFTTLTPYVLQYLKESEWHERSSLKVWKDVYQSILNDDMSKADASKKLVEDAQRERRKDGTNYQCEFFKFNETTQTWEFIANHLEKISSTAS